MMDKSESSTVEKCPDNSARLTANFLVCVGISEQRVRDLLTSALEGGSNYWYAIWQYQLASEYTYADFQENGRMQKENYYHPAELIPFVPGCALVIVDKNDIESDYGATEDKLVSDASIWYLNQETMQTGLQLMAAQYPQHWANFMSEQDDAETGDVFLQLSLFGELIYG